MSVTFNQELLYLVIGAVLGLVVGINLTCLYFRVFGARSAKEQELKRRVRELEQRLRTKDNSTFAGRNAQRTPVDRG